MIFCLVLKSQPFGPRIVRRSQRGIVSIVVAAMTFGLSLGSPSLGLCDTKPATPNIVFMLIDDLGWTDVACFGSKYYETPHIDQLARQGMRFTNAYAACPVCSPTRASILTGKYPARLHLTDYIPGEGNNPNHKLRVPQWTQYLSTDEVTLAKVLKSAGYATASIGKWHLGGAEYSPEHQGFDLNVGGNHWGQPGAFFWPYASKTMQVPGLQAGGKEGEYLTDRLTSEAEKFIDQNKDRPFFLYFPHYAVHVPLQAKSNVIDKYKAKKAVGGQKNPTYAAMIESVDDSVGRMMNKLSELGLDQRTIFIFMSDNGGLWPMSTSNAPLRAGKGFAYEGGIREPLIVKWPGKTKPGSTCAQPVCSIDFFPTVLEICGLTTSAKIDGISFAASMKQNATADKDPMTHTALYWHYPHYWGGNRVKPFGAIRKGDWKLIEFYESMNVELYNLKEDLSEAHDLAQCEVQKADELRQMLHDWRLTVGAQMPTPNPNFHPAKQNVELLSDEELVRRAIED